VQVARAATMDALPVPAGLAPCFAVAIDAVQRQFLLLCGEHADAAGARAAAAAAGVAGWPRRIGPLQDEVRRLD
jgi:hypothetical protein